MMKLIFTSERATEHTGDVYYVDPVLLTTPALHLFVSSHKWESIEIPLDDKIPVDKVRFFPLVTDTIKVKYDECTPEIMRLLCALYPSKAGSIRRAFVEGATELPGVVFA